MTAQQAGGWSRRAFLKKLTPAGAAGVFGVQRRPVAAAEGQQARGPTDAPLVLGSVAERVARLAPCPMHTIRPPGERSLGLHTTVI
jgi:hypothetical protein